MKFFTLLLIGLSTSAYACPNLVGKYSTCTSATGQLQAPKSLDISQSDFRGITTYTVTEKDPATEESSTEQYKTDGKTYTQSSNEDGVTLTQLTASFCHDNTLIINQKIFAGEQEVLSVQATITKNGNKLTQRMDGSTMETQIQDTFICE